MAGGCLRMKIVTILIKGFILRCYEYWRFLYFRAKWRVLNAENLTNAGTIFPIEKVTVGKRTYATLNVISYDNPEERLQIGNYCSIAGQVKFLLSGEHSLNRISTYPFSKLVMGGPSESICKGPIVVDDDVWIGYGCIILSGVHIGQGAVVAAGSVVTKDVEPYTVVGGVPAKKIRERVSTEIASYLTNLDFSQLEHEDICNHRRELLIDMPKNLESIKTEFEWFSKK